MDRGAGRDGKNFLAALQPHFRNRVRALCDVDPEKIKRGYSSPALGIRHIPVVHFKKAVRLHSCHARIYSQGACLCGQCKFCTIVFSVDVVS